MKTPAIQFRSYQKRAFCNRTNGIGIRHGERHTNKWVDWPGSHSTQFCLLIFRHPCTPEPVHC